MTYRDAPQLDKLVADGVTLERLRYAPASLCGHSDGGDGDPIIVKSGKVVCRRCRFNARARIENSNT
jgi:hypothetical protein